MDEDSSDEGPEGGIGAAARRPFHSKDDETIRTVQRDNLIPVYAATGIRTTEFGDAYPKTISATS